MMSNNGIILQGLLQKYQLTSIRTRYNGILLIFSNGRTFLLQSLRGITRQSLNIPINLDSNIVKEFHTKKEWEHIRSCKAIGMREDEFYKAHEKKAFVFQDLLFAKLETSARDLKLTNIHKSKEEWEMILTLGITKDQLSKLTQAHNT